MVAIKRLSSGLNRLILKQTALIATALAIFLIAPPLKAEVIFEGYSKVLLDGTHIGYVVQRYELDTKKKEFSTSYLLKTNQLGGNITESLKARSGMDLKPISYQYTELAGERVRTIDASFKNDTMTATIMADGQKETVSKKLPKGTFLASFLGYVMLQGKEGIKKDVKYGYQAIAEEDANLYSGEAFISGEETVNGVSAFKVLNTFKGIRFVSFVTHKGEVVATRSPAQKIATDLVANIQEATAGLPINSNVLSQLFGGIPKGEENVIARRGTAKPQSSQESKPQTTQEPGKKQGLPPGQGVIIKPAPEKSEAAEPSTEPSKDGKTE